MDSASESAICRLSNYKPSMYVYCNKASPKTRKGPTPYSLASAKRASGFIASCPFRLGAPFGGSNEEGL
jgi:hypothetical protein